MLYGGPLGTYLSGLSSSSSTSTPLSSPPSAYASGQYSNPGYLKGGIWRSNSRYRPNTTVNSSISSTPISSNPTTSSPSLSSYYTPQLRRKYCIHRDSWHYRERVAPDFIHNDLNTVTNSPTDYKRLYEAEKVATDELREEVAAAQKETRELQEQISAAIRSRRSSNAEKRTESTRPTNTAPTSRYTTSRSQPHSPLSQVASSSGVTTTTTQSGTGNSGSNLFHYSRWSPHKTSTNNPGYAGTTLGTSSSWNSVSSCQ
ncbi:hypothetical protein AHF37_06492 [Paragonimus kellicotti]|nr:hypothetical protein AHF37_06492 [Paragonimus kellicotti]